MRRWPLIPTLLVALAVATMIGLGVWQLQRRAEKEALLARLARNTALPPVAFPRVPVGDELLFRRTTAFCLQPTGWTRVGGRGVKGLSGWRHIARCRVGAEGPGISFDMGVSRAPDAGETWRGGEVSGIIGHAPGSAPLIMRLFGRPAPPTLMVVADTPAPGLEASAPPTPESVPNNHLAYAGQWFLFAGAAAVIYVLAVRRRWRVADERAASADPLPHASGRSIPPPTPPSAQ